MTSTFDYFEKQQGLRCAEHAMNNLVNGPVWWASDLEEASEDQRKSNWNSADIVTAINTKKFEAIIVVTEGTLKSLPKTYFEQLVKNPKLVGFIARPKDCDHWVAIRCKVDEVFKLYDSNHYDSKDDPVIVVWNGVNKLWEELKSTYDPDLIAVASNKGTFDTIRAAIRADRREDGASASQTGANAVDLT